MEKKIALTGEGVLHAIIRNEKVGPIVNVSNLSISSTPISVGYPAIKSENSE